MWNPGSSCMRGTNSRCLSDAWNCIEEFFFSFRKSIICAFSRRVVENLRISSTHYTHTHTHTLIHVQVSQVFGAIESHTVYVRFTIALEIREWCRGLACSQSILTTMTEYILGNPQVYHKHWEYVLSLWSKRKKMPNSKEIFTHLFQNPINVNG